MKVMKKVVIVCLILAMLLPLVACSNEHAGLWSAKEIEVDGETKEYSDYSGREFNIFLQNNGSCYVVIGAKQRVGSWEDNDKGFHISCKDPEVEDEEALELDVIVDGNTATVTIPNTDMTMNGDGSMVKVTLELRENVLNKT